MICMCVDEINKLPSVIQPLNANLGAVASANLKAAAQLGLAANAALSAHASAAAQASASAQAGGAAQLGLGASFSHSFNAGMMAQLSALGSFNAALRANCGINMTSPSAGAQLNQVFDSLAANGLAKALGQLPAGALPTLSQLANLANASLSAQAGLGVNLAANANAAAQLQASANAAASGAVNLNAAAMANASLGAFAQMMASVQGGFGIDLTAPGGMGQLNGLLPTVNANVASMPPIGNVVSAALLKKAQDLLDALDAIKKGLGIDLLQAGAGANLNASLAAMANAAGSAAAGMSGSAASSGSLQAGAAESAGAQGQDSVSAQAAASVQALEKLGFPGGLSALPTIPPAGQLLAAVTGKIQSMLGIPMVAHAPCGKQCLMAATPLIPCPIAVAAAAKKAV